MKLLCRLFGHLPGQIPDEAARRRLSAAGVKRVDWWAGPTVPGCVRCWKSADGKES